MKGTLTVTEPGILTVTDLGRVSGGRLGQMRGGALDQYAARVANTLVGNSENAPLLELLAMDAAVVTSLNLMVSVTGAPADITVDGARLPQWQPFVWPAGSELRIKHHHRGLRIYIAVQAELVVPHLLGSCAPDSVLGFGAPVLRGDEIELLRHEPLLTHPHFGIPVFQLPFDPPAYSSPWTIPVTDGPDAAEFGASGTLLFEHPYIVTPTSNHIGLRCASLDDAPIPVRQTRQEVLSRGVPVGAVEVPPGDQLLILHRGRGVTAGYPVLAVVTTVGLDRLGQAAPGHILFFERVTVQEAVAAARARRLQLDILRRSLEAARATYTT